MLTPVRVVLLVAAVMAGLPPATGASPVETVPEAHTVALEGIDMRYETVGEGEPLLLLHAGTQTARMFDPFVAELAARYRLILPDLRGHGGSTNPGGEWSTRQFARDVLALLDHLGVDRIRAIGASAGGMTLLHMATRQPERLEAMVVVGVGTYLPVACREILSRTDADALSPDAWQALRARHAHGDEQIRGLYAWIASLAHSCHDMSFTPDVLSTITARTLIVHGDRDYCFPASMAWDIYAAIPDAYLWVVPNGGHVPIRGPHAAPFVQTVLAFLEGGW